MAARGSLQHIFDNILPENPTLLESLSWNQIKPIEHQSPNSFTEIFSELLFNESPLPSPSSSSKVSSSTSSSSSSSSSSIEININHKKLNQNENSESPHANQTSKTNHANRHKSSDSFSSISSESLQLFTEGLGFESSEGLKCEMSECWETRDIEKEGCEKYLTSEDKYCRRRSRVVKRGGYPPPISCIGRVWFRSYRSNGRFVLEETRIPKQEFLHAYREDGRLRLQLVQPQDDEFLEEDDDVECMDDVGSVEEKEENVDRVTDHLHEEAKPI